MPNNEFELAHPYPRYGLAVALLQAGIKPETATEQDVRNALIKAIEEGLGKFRINTSNNPDKDNELHFRYIEIARLKSERDLIYSKGLADKGVYLSPSIITNEINFQQTKTIPSTFDTADSIAEDLRANEPLIGSGKSVEDSLDKTNGEKRKKTKPDLVRAIAPIVAERNNGGADSKSPKGSLLERACCAVAAITPWKAAAKVGKSNTAIFPDLPLDELYYFVKFLKDMMTSEKDERLMIAKIERKSKNQSKDTSATTGKSKSRRGKKEEEEKKEDEESAEEEKSKFRRPPLCYGNYPYAPRLSGVIPFGGSSLLAAIGRWAQRYEKVEQAREVLESIAGTENIPGKSLYIVSYERVSQESYKHYIVDLALEHKLSELIQSLIYKTELYADAGKAAIDRRSNEYKLFYMTANRFLQQFNFSAFSDFLSSRAEYPPEIQPLFEVYFMKEQEIDREIVDAAAAYGQWLNKSAYRAALDSFSSESGGNVSPQKIQEAKAKVLIELESAMISARTPQAMLALLAGRTLRLMQSEAPQEAMPFLTATATGKLEPETARHLITAFMRVSTFQKRAAPNVSDPDKYPNTPDSPQTAEEFE